MRTSREIHLAGNGASCIGMWPNIYLQFGMLGILLNLPIWWIAPPHGIRKRADPASEWCATSTDDDGNAQEDEWGYCPVTDCYDVTQARFVAASATAGCSNGEGGCVCRTTEPVEAGDSYI